MAETVSLVTALVVVAGVAGGVPLAALDGPPAQVTDEPNETATANASLAPGERLAGTVGVERAAVTGEMAGRAFGQRVAAADSNDSRAEVVAAQIGDLQARLDELQAREATLRAAHQNGSLSMGQYRARMAQLHAHQRALQRQATRTERVAGRLPATTLEQNGVNVTAIRMVRSQAGNLTGPEVAAMARNIAGPGAGHGMGPRAVAGNGTGPGAGPMGPDGTGPGAGPAGNGSGMGPDGDGMGPGDDGMGPDGDGGPPSDGNETAGGPGGDGMGQNGGPP